MTSSPRADTDSDVHDRIRQQEVVAELGQRALESDDIDGLLDEAAEAVAETLDVEYAKVLEVCSGGEMVLLRHGVGWDDGLVGTATVPTDHDSQAGYTLGSEQPVIVDDLRTEERFSGPELLTDHGVVSGLSVIIGSVDEPWGVLGAHATERREFTDHDVNFVQSVANILASAIENTQTERRFEAIFEDPNILVGLLEPDGTVLDINQTAMEYIDADLEAVTGEPFWETPWWGDGDEVGDDVREWTERAAAGEYVEFEADLTRPDGERYTLNGVFRPVTNDEGEVVSIIVSDRDVTERKRRERQLRKSEQRHRTLAENLPNGIVTMFDDELRYTLAAGRAFDDLPLSPSDVEGEHVRDVWPDHVSRALEDAFRAALDGETRAIDLEYVGREWVIRAVPITDDDGNVFSGMTIAQDITERKESQRKLERSERRYRTLAENFPNGAVGVYDRDLRYTLVEGAAIGDRLPERDVLEGERIPDIAPPEAAETLESLFRAAIEDGHTDSVTIELNGRDWRVWATPLRDSDGDIFAGLSFTQDITDQLERQRRLEASNERLEQFAYAASHDLQEPLRMVSSYLQLIESRYEDRLDEDGEEFLAFAIDGANRMRSMINGLLEYSRVDTQGDPLEPIDLDDVLESALEDLQVRIEETNAEITVEELPRVEGDESQLRQVFQNLLSNAIEYAGDEPPRIHVEAERIGRRYEISVADEGIGIDSSDQERVFEVFQRLHSREEHAGTGIGLALCQRIVERHDGRMWVDSEPGEGATFSFTLPAAE